MMPSRGDGTFHDDAVDHDALCKLTADPWEDGCRGGWSSR